MLIPGCVSKVPGAEQLCKPDKARRPIHHAQEMLCQFLKTHSHSAIIFCFHKEVLCQAALLVVEIITFPRLRSTRFGRNAVLYTPIGAVFPVIGGTVSLVCKNNTLGNIKRSNARFIITLSWTCPPVSIKTQGLSSPFLSVRRPNPLCFQSGKSYNTMPIYDEKKLASSPQTCYNNCVLVPV